MARSPPPSYCTNEESDLDDVTEYQESASPGVNSDETKLIIGLDFGTTYSGVAYAFSDKPENIQIVRSWPGNNNRQSDKCPTLIEYHRDSTFSWGFEVDRASISCIQAIKLLLDPDQPKPAYYVGDNGDMAARLRRLDKTPLDVASDYITAIYQHAIQTIRSEGFPEYVDPLPKQLVLSVPAVWSDKAKDLTLEAARNAGIDSPFESVKLIKEPEAGALSTIHSMRNRGLNVGDALVVCDAGGGTVDLISYEITSLQPFKLAELTTCTGGLAGSLMINRSFEY